MLNRSHLVILVIVNFYPRAHAHPFMRLDDKPHEAPRIIEAHLHGDGVRVAFADGDHADLWLAMLCTGNKDKPIVCYQSSTTLVYPYIENQLSYMPKPLSVVWWVEIRDLFGATVQHKLSEEAAHKRSLFSEISIIEHRRKEENCRLSFHVDDRALPLNVWVKSSQGKILYQGSFVTSGTKNIIFNSGLKQNLMLYYSGATSDGQEAIPQ